MKLYQIKIRRDAQTITTIEVPEHEIALLQTIFGEENVQNMRGESIAMSPLTDADAISDKAVDATIEFDRLTAKYGANDDGSFVEQVFGKKASRGLETALAAIETKEAKAAAAAPKPDGKAKTPAVIKE